MTKTTAVQQFIRRAAQEGLVDVAYGSYDSPIGELALAATRKGLVRVALNPATEDIVTELADEISPRVLEMPSRLDDVRRELDEYFAGNRDRFDVPVDMQLARGFGRRVLDAVARIPFGSVSTYKDMATAAGNPRAYRAAGNAIGSNPVPIVVPCHRVLHSGGGLGGYGGGLDRKRFLLRLEGVLE
jgi:methylated-DNA-[protein]-cysteine S-methyltransferase